MQNLIINMWKILIRNKESSYLTYWDVEDLCDWAMLQKLAVDGFEWVEDTFQFNKDFIKSYNQECDRGNFLEVDMQYRQDLHKTQIDLQFLTERMKNVAKLI